MEYIKEHKEIVWVLGVILVTVVLLFISKKTHQIITKKLQKAGRDASLVTWLKRIAMSYLYIQGALLVSYVFLEKSMHDFVNRNLQKIFILAFAAVFTIILLGIVKIVFQKLIRKATVEADKDPTAYKFLHYLSSTIVLILGVLIASFAFPELQALAQTALAGAGIIAVVIGVASQEAIANVIGGIFIIIYRPFKIGDILKIREDMIGTVEDITLRHTVINNYQNKRIVVPNAMINKEKLINYDLGEKKTCQWIEIGISYDSDINVAKSILEKACLAHPNLIDNRDYMAKKNEDPKVIVRIISLGDSSVNLRAWAWAKDYPSAFVMKCEVMESTKKEFDKNNIEIPFPQRTVTIKKDSELSILHAKPVK